MGLDSTLYAKAFCFEGPARNAALAAGFPSVLIEDGCCAYVQVAVAYWRKFNALHKWFVDQSGCEDNCEDIYISTEQLKELFQICLQIQQDPSKAEELLPPQEGFFFGSTEVDDYYFEQIDYTLKRLDLILKQLEDNHRISLVYSASW